MENRPPLNILTGFLIILHAETFHLWNIFTIEGKNVFYEVYILQDNYYMSNILDKHYQHFLIKYI